MCKLAVVTTDLQNDQILGPPPHGYQHGFEGQACVTAVGGRGLGKTICGEQSGPALPLSSLGAAGSAAD